MKSIDVISIPVTDQERSKNFYLLLGFELLDETPMSDGNKWIHMGLAGCPTTITLVTWFKKMPAGSIQGLVLRTDDIETDILILKNNGATVSGIEETPGGKFASVKDPDGNGISLQQR
jgi:catechol 2,3-dioxygenase-like lactoylglutathione lyase family enzyme